MGSVIKVEDRKYPERHKILSSDGTVGQLAMVLSVGYVHIKKSGAGFVFGNISNRLNV